MSENEHVGDISPTEGAPLSLAKKYKKDHNYYFYYLINYLPDPMTRQDIVRYEKVITTQSTPSSEIGKYKITFADGSDITHQSIEKHFPEFTWPSFPLVCDNENDAKVFKRSWELFIIGQSKVRSKS